MFETELMSIKTDLEFLQHLRRETKKIRTNKIKRLVFKKIAEQERIIRDIESSINIEMDIERFPDLTSEEKNQLHGKIYELAHTVENFIVTQENAEVFLIEKIEHLTGDYSGDRAQLIEKEIFEIRLLKTFKKLLVQINRILKKHKTEFRDEIEKLTDFRKKIVEMYIDMKKLIHQTKKELVEVERDKLIFA